MKSYLRGGCSGSRVMTGVVTLGIALFLSGIAQAASQYNLTCDDCHRMPPLDSGIGIREPGNGAFKGNHEAHADTRASSCAKCHGNAVLSYETGHRTKAIQVKSTGINNSPAGGSYSRGFFNQTSVPPNPLGTCATVNCHFETITPAWGGTAWSSTTDCDKCHNTTRSAGHPVSGSKHGTYYGTGTSACVKCHPDHTGDVKPFAHATSVTNRGISVQFTTAPNNGGSYSGPTNDFLPSQSNVFGTCSGIYCHSDGKSVSGPYTVTTAPTWGGTLGCNGCHGGPATLGSPIATGQHTAHINNQGTLGANYGCVECHAKTAATDSQIGTISNHVNTFVDFSGAKAGKVYSGGNCSTAYCHTSGKKGRSGMASTVEPANPSWTSGSALGCNGCHGAKQTPTAGVDFNSVAGEPNYLNGGAGADTANSHKKHVSAAGATTCANCHSKTTSNGTSIVAGGQHIDTFVNYTAGNGKTFGKQPNKTCSNISCHSGNGIVTSVGIAQWGATLDCNGCHGGPVALGTNILATGKHTQHTNQASVIGDNFGCVDCHAKTVANNTTISDTTKHMNSFVDYSGVKAGRSTTYSGGVCSATYCHSSGKKGVSGMVGTVEPASPSWSGAALSCNGCHGAQVTPTAGVAFNSTAGEPNYVNGGAGANNANSHQKHVTTGASACANCHSKTTGNGTSIIAGSQHIDNFVNYTAGNGKTFAKLTNKSCSNISCHSGNGIVASVGNAQWGATLDCNGCHGGPAALGTNILASGKHTQHTNQASVIGDNLGCVECHSKTVSSNTTISDTTKHMNSFLDYSGVKAGKSTTYSGGSCSSTYCHTSGKKGKSGMVATVEPANPSWSGGALGCNGCHGAQVTPTAGVAFNSTAGEPNYVNGGAGANNANSHQKHVTTGASACANCHSKTTANGTAIIAGSQHMDTFANYTAGNGKSFGRVTNKSCSNISCHSGNGIVTSVGTAQWGATLDCNGCHGGPAALGTNILASGKHTQHTNQTSILGDNYGCVECHAKTVSSNTTISNTTNHMNAYLDYSGVKAGKSTTYSGGVCSATYCHTSGKKGLSGMVATVEPANPSWSGAALSCNGCHGAQVTPTAGVAFNSTAGEPNYVNGGAGANNANSHQKHVTTGASACANCHSKTTANGTSIIAGSQHTDNFVNYTAGNGKTFGKLANKTCSNISCHSGSGIVASVGNAQWGATLDCNGCHGGPAALGTNILASGKHTQHTNQASVIGDNLGCAECHSKTVSSNTTISDTTKHMNSFLDYSGVKAGKSTTYSGGVCSATYCHSSGKKGKSGMVATVEPANPSWSGGAIGCNGCHGAQVTPTAGVAFNSTAGEPNYVNGGAGANNANSHQKHVTTGASACANCHSKTTANGTAIIAGSQHMDTFANYTAGNGKSFGRVTNKSCSNISCHSGSGIVASVATAQWGATLDCNGCHGGPAALGTNIIATGKHTQHVNQASVIGDNLLCAECHAKTVVVNTAIADTTKHMNSFLDYSGVRAGNSATYSGGVCSNTYCHTSGKKGTAGMVATVEPGSPSWSGAALSCNGCHGAQLTPTAGVDFNSVAGEPNYVNGGAGAANANSHLKHVGSSGAATCGYCHSKTTTNGTSIVAAGQHLNSFVNYTAGNGKTFGKQPAKTCSNISCHSGNGIIASVGNAQWGATLGCNGCHGGPASLGTNILATGKHAAHMNNATLLGANYGCVDCHAKTASSDSSIADTTKHGNAFVDYSGVRAGKSSTYAGGVCSASYCHTSGKKGQAGMVATVEPANPSWSGAALSCKGCHGAQVTPTAGVAFNSVAGEPNYVNGGSAANNANSHQKHVKTDGATTCVYCHSNTVDATGTAIIGSHTNRSVDVFNGGTKSFSYIGGKTCSNISCHSGTNFTSANAVWGSTMDCKGCHPTLSGAHTRHIGTAWATLPFYNYTANLSSGSDTDGVTWKPYAYGCANCHPVTLASHMDGVVEVETSTVTGGSVLRNKNSAAGFVGSIGTGTVKCSNVYCHYNVTTPQWNQTFTAATRCSGCHENAPSTDSHLLHKVAIHYDDIYTGTSGLLPASGAVGVNAGHGDPAQATTIGCNICHYDTVNLARNKYNTNCSTASCHGNTTGNNVDATGAARITNLAFHVNGANNVSFAPVTIVKSKAQIRSTGFAAYTSGLAGWSNTSRIYKDGTASAYDKSKNYLTVGSYVGGNCSNIACHNGVTVNWTTDFGGAQDCMMCHTNM